MPDRRDPPPTDEGWYVLHDFRRIDWDAWRDAPERVRQRALDEAVGHLQSHLAVEDAEDGASALYSILGHKADVLLLHMRPTTADIGAVERRFERTEFAGFTERTTSFVSVTEASGYSERAREYFEGDLDEDSGLARYIQSRLKPTVPDATHVCFYPMDKRRQPEQNWYDLSFEERAEHMDAHGDIGRDYGGKVTQMITGAIAIDDWEWGVTLWGDDLADMKDLLYEMRFDPSTSQFADFGSFYVGRRFPPEDLQALLAGEPVPTGTDAEAAGDESAADAAPAHPADATDEDHVSASASDESAADPDPAHGHTLAGDNGRGDHSQANVGAGHESESHANANVAASDHGSSRHGHDDADGGTEHAAGDDVAGHAVREEATRDHATGDHAASDHAVGDRAAGDADDHGGPHPGSAAQGDHPHDDSTVEDPEDLTARLGRLGLEEGSDYEAGTYAVVLYSDADAQELAAEVDDLRENFEHYDSHVTTVVRAQDGRSAVVSIWATERAADTAEGFLTDLPGVGEAIRGPLGEGDRGAETTTNDAGTGGDASGTDTDHSGTEEEVASIREELADLDVYAGKPHGEDVYALVLYSQADRETLVEEVEDLSDGFDRYDTHEGTTVYQDVDGDALAVVSLWATQDAADTAADFLTDLPGVVGWARKDDGFGTMGMFYTVKPEYCEDFREKFATVGDLLEGMDGHRETALLENYADENDMFIASQWDSKEDAMAFFRSEEFAQTVDWGRDVLADRPRHVFLA